MSPHDHRLAPGRDAALRMRMAQGLDNLENGAGQVRLLFQAHADAHAHSTPGEVQHVVDQLGHAPRRGLRTPAQSGDLGLGPLKQQFRGHAHRRQRIAQVVYQDGDELFPQFGGGLLVQTCRVGRSQLIFAVEHHGDQTREGSEGGHGLRIGHLAWRPIHRAEVAEVHAVGAHDGHGDVASDPVGARGLVLAQGRVHIERTARHQAVCDVVLDCTGGPSVFRDPLAEQLFLARYQEWLISRRLRTPTESAINSLALYLNELEPTRRDRGKYQAR
jgi:hypothetical protein